MAVDRRGSVRQAVHWQATLKSDHGREFPVVIRDFCLGGLFLEFGETTNSRALTDTVSVELHDPLSQSARRVESRIVRRSDTGVAIAFNQPMPDLVTVLRAISEGRTLGAGRAPADPQLAERVRRVLEEASEEFVRRTLPTFIKRVTAELFEQARVARTGEEQSANFAAFRRMKAVQSRAAQEYGQRLHKRFAELGRSGSKGEAASLEQRSADDLKLVDDRDFEDWLNRSEVVSRARLRFRAPLERVNRRLASVFQSAIDEDNSPVGPAVLCEVLSEATPVREFEGDAAHLVYVRFGRLVLSELESLYERLNRDLVTLNVLPGLETEKHAIRKSESSSRPPADDKPDSKQESKSEQTAPSARRGIGIRWEKPGANSGMGAPAARRPDDGDPKPPAHGLPDPQRALAAQRALHDRKAGAQGRGAPAPPETRFEDPQVIEAVERLASTVPLGAPQAAARNQLSRSVMESLGTGTLEALPEQTRDTVELLDGWFGDIGENALNTGFLRDWSGRMALVALRLQLQSGDFLQAEPRPIHDLLNQIDRAGVALATVPKDERDAIRAQLDTILKTAIDERKAETNALDEASEAIGGLITQPLRARAANMQRVLQQCQGAQKLERARHLVNLELDRRIARREIPKLLNDFIETGWRNLLVLVRLRLANSSDHWRRSLAVVDRLMVALGTGRQRARPIPQADKVLGYARRQLDSYARMTPELRALLAEIETFIQGVESEGRAPRPLPMVTAMPSARDGDVALDRIAPRWLGQAKLLGVGDWVFFAGVDGNPEPLRLQWINEERNRFVFVNRSGHKAQELSLAELAQLLEAAAAGVSEDLDAPLTERQWQRRMQEMHEEMVRHATHDALTQCLNRKAMVREIERLTAQEADGETTHALIFASLDGFKVVNGTLGDEVGDELLQRFADVCRETVSERGQVGRMGGDEFALLVRSINADDALAMAEGLRERLAAAPLTERQGNLTLSTSVGVVCFRHSGQRPEALLRDADEACIAAKQAGGNSVHLVRPDDLELQQLRSNMARAAKVDEALKKGHLSLRCQLIQPVVANGDLKPYYEVLISMKGANDEVIPPDEFIPAAERFGRMNAVDRWVTREAIAWCAEHDDVLDELAGITVNLSGPTLNDSSFARFVREQFERTGVDPRRVCFEVTETAAVENLSRAADLINELKRLGCQFALDDFGTGLSSYSYLKNLPVDYLKIDGQFIRNIDTEEADQAMVRSINDLSHYLGKHTIGEYVENNAILSAITEIGLDYAQGYGIRKPIPMDDLGGYLARRAELRRGQR